MIKAAPQINGGGKSDSFIMKAGSLNGFGSLPFTIYRGRLQVNEKPKREKKTIKLTGERRASLIRVPKYKPESKKIDCFYDIKIKGFCPTKDTIDKANREVAEWKKA